MSTAGRIRLGIEVDRDYRGAGTKVSRVNANTNASKLGMKVGDIIVAMDDKQVGSLGDLRAALLRKRDDQAIKVTVKRGEEQIVMEGQIPAFVPSPRYRRDEPTARISLRAEGNSIRVVSKNVRRFKLYLSPDLFDDGPVQVSVNGRPVSAEAEAIPLATLLSRYALEADAGRLFTREVVIDLKRG